VEVRPFFIVPTPCHHHTHYYPGCWSGVGQGVGLMAVLMLIAKPVLNSQQQPRCMALPAHADSEAVHEETAVIMCLPSQGHSPTQCMASTAACMLHLTERVSTNPQRTQPAPGPAAVTSCHVCSRNQGAAGPCPDTRYPIHITQQRSHTCATPNMHAATAWCVGTRHHLGTACGPPGTGHTRTHTRVCFGTSG
jgi:hypothetical protein